MRKLKLIFFTAMVAMVANAQNVNIPDANFKAYLVGNAAINTNGDTEIQVSEAAAFTGTIDCSIKNIANLTGIEAFTALTTLYCQYNQLTSLNISTNTALTNLRCYSNRLTALNVSANTALTYLSCSENQLTSLNVSANTALTNLSCGENQLTSLNVSANTALTTLGCHSNQLTSLNISANTALQSISCYENQLTSLDVSANKALTSLTCFSNHLSSLDVSANKALVWLYCSSNQLISLNVRNGNNTKFSLFEATGNPGLTCIQADNAAWATTNWTNIDPTAGFCVDISASVTPANSGTVTGAGTYKYVNNITLTAIPATGYAFVNWTENNTPVSTSAAYSFNATANRVLIANFALTYSVSASVTPANSGTITGVGTYSHGTNVTLTATPNIGYTFVNWTENGTPVSTSAAYSFNATANRVLIANFAPVTGITEITGTSFISIYPNPVKNELTIELKDSKENLDFQIVNTQGQVVYRGKITGKAPIQTGSFTPGIYLLKLHNAGKEEVIKIIKE